jgi:hypothetical protein
MKSKLILILLAAFAVTTTGNAFAYEINMRYFDASNSKVQFSSDSFTTFCLKNEPDEAFKNFLHKAIKYVEQENNHIDPTNGLVAELFDRADGYADELYDVQGMELLNKHCNIKEYINQRAFVSLPPGLLLMGIGFLGFLSVRRRLKI